MPSGRTKKQYEERKRKIAEFRWKVLPLVTSEWQHISHFLGLVDSTLSKDITRKWVWFALKRLEQEGKVEYMRDPNFPGTYWRLKGRKEAEQ
jgi:hypothetical protein